jgi:hypothetical protein
MRAVAGGIDLGKLFEAAEQTLRVEPLSRPDELHWTGLVRLADALMRAAQGEAPALRAARREIGGWIQSYVAFERDRVLHCQIVEVPVEKPLFLVGFGRTGSTLLHNLLALAPKARAPLLWELFTPSPPPKPSADDAAERIEVARHRLEFLAKFAPVVSLAHPMAPDAPDECHWMMRHSPLWVMLYDVPDYWAWLKSLSSSELRQLYAHYRLQVQHVTLLKRGYWVSKAFSHLHFMSVLHDVFPDARIIRLHRDPTAAIPSLCSLAQSRRSIYSSRVDPRAIGAGMLDLFLDGMARSMALDRARPDAPVVDVHFAELVADPIGTARRVLGRLGYPCDASAERAMQAYLEKAAAAPAYQHRYSLEEFGLDRAEVLDRSAEYLAWAEARCGRSLVG